MYLRWNRGSLEVLTPAKLNLFLEVLGRRADGFHEIETVMMPVNLFDCLSIDDNPGGELRVACRWAPGYLKSQLAGREHSPWEALPEGDGNIAMRALRLLRDRAGIERGANLQITKRIPSAAGLGGGSSDGAAALVAGNEFWGLRWSRARLAELAAELGSDVPFFLGGAPAVCRGRGEIIQSQSQPRAVHFAIACPPAGLSTAAVYKECHPATKLHSAEALIAALQAGHAKTIAASLFNRLESAAARLCPWIERLREAFAAQGCWGSQMSGSGTSYFGICRSAGHARRMAARLRSAGLDRVYPAHSL